MKNGLFYALLIALFAFAGWEIGYQGISFPTPLPEGNWQKIADISQNQFGVGLANLSDLRILSVDYWLTDMYLDAVSYGGNGGNTISIWDCNLKTGLCALMSDQASLPFDQRVITWTRDVKISEVPPLPGIGRYWDLLKIKRHVSDDILTSYFVLLDDGQIWTYAYYSSAEIINSFMIIITRIVVGLTGSIIGILIAIMLVLLKIRISRKKAVSVPPL